MTEQDQSAVSAQQTDISKLPVEFKGNGFEYFQIWIVNIVLTIVTLGIYSAWATVRNKRYLYSNTYVDGTSFSFLAEPMTILKARLMAVGIFILISVAGGISPAFSVMFGLALIIAIPFFINQSLAFKMRNTAYKNIQFRFSASYGEAFKAIYLWPLLGILSLGILYPLAILRGVQYRANNTAYGTTNFQFNGTFKDYAVVLLIAAGLGVAAAIIVAAIGQPLGTVISFLVYFAVITYVIVATSNLFYMRLQLKEHGFDSNMTVLGYSKTMLINIVLIVLTLGLYLPAAQIRMIKYVTSCITMHANGSLSDFAAAEQENVTAFGEEFGQVMDLGI